MLGEEGDGVVGSGGYLVVRAGCDKNQYAAHGPWAANCAASAAVLMMRGGSGFHHLMEEGARGNKEAEVFVAAKVRGGTRHASRRTAGSSLSHMLGILVLVLLSSLSDSQTLSDSTRPDVSSVKMVLGDYMKTDVISLPVDTSKCSLASCGNPWDSGECMDSACFVKPVFEVWVSDLSSKYDPTPAGLHCGAKILPILTLSCPPRSPETEPYESGVGR